MAILYLEWDSNFFEYKVGEIKNTEDMLTSLELAKKEGYKLLYVRTQDTNMQDYYLGLGGKLVDEKLTFVRNVPKTEKIENTSIQLYENTVISEDLRSLALQSGIYSRFKIDTEFKNQEFERLYTTWIENSVKKQIAKEVIISVQSDKIVGLLTLGIKNQRADIGILAVDESYRGAGIGRSLMYRAFLESKKLHQMMIQVVTQKANISACEFYKNQGFELEKTENIYHFWL